MASYQINNPSSGQSPIERIRNQIRKNNDSLDKVNQLVDWNALVKPLEDVIKSSLIGTSRPYSITLMIKSFVLQMIYGLSDYQLSIEINDRRSFQQFLNLQFGEKLPDAEDISKYRELLIKEGLYKKLFNSFYKQLLDANFFTEEAEKTEEKSSEADEKEKMLNDKLKELEELTKRLTEEKKEELPVVQREKLESTGEEKFEDKLKKIDEELKSLYTESPKTEDESDKLYDKLQDIDKKLKDLYEKAESKPEKVTEEIRREKTPSEEKLIKETITERPDEKIYEKEERTIKSEEHEKEDEFRPELPVVHMEKLESAEETKKETERKREGQIKIKRSLPIFNETNLTEDYELGLRFYKMGVRTSFINLQTDEKNPESLIATGEYFPNDFWGAVRQRSRWIAGISYQNWSLHKWTGNFKTKYFLFRDRKTVLSSVVTFLSYFLFTYFLVYLITIAFGLEVLVPLVYKDSILWYLLIACFIFMVLRILHRFFFTYKWYGFRYAFFSIIRLVFDNIINFFATIRAWSVFKKSKSKFAWESTSHY